MGNQLIKNYDIQKDCSGVGGYNSYWKIYPGLRQDRSIQGPNQVSIFMLDKKFLDKASKSIREDLYAFLRKEASLAKFKHPYCLSMIEPLVEDQKNMAFVTEHVQSSLQNFIVTNNISELYSTDFETKMHLLELLQALSFLHNDVKIAHLGVSPENIYATSNGKWKLGGMIFTTQVLSNQLADSNNVSFSTKHEEILHMHPNLSFSAPEVCELSSKCCFASDVFSLGLLIFALFKAKHEQNTASIYAISANNLQQYKGKAANLAQNVQNEKFFKEMPASLKNLLVKMLSFEPNSRPSVTEILASAWFNDPFIQTIAHLETMAQKDVGQQQLLLKGLSKILLKFEGKVIKTKILPILMDFLKLEQLSPIIIQIIISILEQNTILNKTEFNEIVWPALKSLATGKEIPAQALYLLVSNLKTVCEFVSNSDLQTFLMPLILKCYECGVAKLQELALQNTEFLVKKLDFVFIKTKILPRVLKLCVDNSMELRRSSLFCLNKIYHLFERVTIIEQVIGTLEKIKKLGADAKMNVIILNIYEGIAKTIGIEVVATKILPNLVSNLADVNLSKAEFKSYIKTIQALLQKIEEERLADPSGNPSKNALKEEDSDMAKILKEIDDMDKDQSKKNNEIFSAMQGPSSANDFDFLSLFDTNTNSNNFNSVNANNQKNEAFSIENNAKNNSISGEIGEGSQKIEGKASFEKKVENNFDFFNEIENKSKILQPISSETKAKVQNKGLFNQAMQLKKSQNSSETANNNNNFTSVLNNNDNNFGFISSNTNNTNNFSNNTNNFNNNNTINFNNNNNNVTNNTSQNLLSSGMSMNATKTQKIGVNANNPVNIGSNKGNMLKLDYDPFADLNNLGNNNSVSSNNNNNNYINNNNSANPFSNPVKNTNINTNNNNFISNFQMNKPNNDAINFNDLDSFNNMIAPKNKQPNLNNPTNFNNPAIKSTNFTSNTSNFNNSFANMSFKTSQNPPNLAAKKLDDFDFFQNAVPVDQSLKIKKINPTYNNNSDDLI